MEEVLVKDDLELEELLKEDKLSKKMKVLFVCTGNTCRSPMAEAALNYLGKGKYKAYSAGLSAFPNDEISYNAILALKDAGILSTEDNNYENHRAKMINYELIETCDLIIGITSNHTRSLIMNFPEFKDKILCMPEEIPDPFKGDIEEYKECLRKIIDGIKILFEI